MTRFAGHFDVSDNDLRTSLPAAIGDDENPEWTDEDFARARSARDVLPAEVVAAFATRGKRADPDPRDDDAGRAGTG